MINISRTANISCQNQQRNLTTFLYGVLTMYRPNFCADCGAKIIRLNWYPWTSRRFCKSCASRLRKARLTIPLVIVLATFVGGLLIGRSGRKTTPPLIIERSGKIEAQSTSSPVDTGRTTGISPGTQTGNNANAESNDVVYICGARTRKGTPCSRRVHGPVRCWQHTGMPAMVPAERLVVR